MAKNRRQTQARKKRTKQSRCQVNRIDVLPDEVLLEIFDFYMNTEEWESLVHVCRRWRSLVLGSSRRLNVQLLCTNNTPTKDSLDIWPALPLFVSGAMAISGTDNVVAALEQSDRVSQVELLVFANWQLKEVLAPMQVPFPALTDLQLASLAEMVPVIPDSSLDGSATRLQSFELNGIPFPGLPKLLSSATQLVNLRLCRIHHSGYISPEAIVALLSVLSSLRMLHLEFQSPQSRPLSKSRRSLPSPKCSILPALDEFHFEGTNEYLEDFVTGIDTPQLDEMRIKFFNQDNFDCQQLAQFINSTPTLRVRDEAHVKFDDESTSVVFRARRFKTLEIEIECGKPDSQLSSVTQICNSSLPPLCTIEDLYIKHEYSRLVWKNNATLWLELLLPFTAVRNLYTSKHFAPGIAAALKELVGSKITEVLPSLQNIFVGGLQVEPSRPFQENIGQFVTARQLSGHPVAVSIRKGSFYSSETEEEESASSCMHSYLCIYRTRS